MTLLAHKLRHRAEILQPIQEPNSTTGGAVLSYEHKATVWCDLKPMNFRGSQVRYIRNQQVGDVPTHAFTMRKNPTLGVDFLGPNPLIKGTTFLRIDQGEGRWRVWRVMGVSDKDERGEQLEVAAKEVEQQVVEGLVT